MNYLNSKSKVFAPFRLGGLSICLFFCLLFSIPIFADEKPISPTNEYLQTSWTTENGLPQNSVNSIIQSRDGYLWLATFGGLARFDGVKFTTFNSGNTPGLINNRIISLCEDRNGAIWLGTQNGEIMVLKDGVGKSYTTADGVPGGDVVAIKEMRDGTMWFATTNELTRFENGRFIIYREIGGLPNNRALDLLEDNENNLWVLTDDGIAEFKNDHFTLFNSPNQIPEKRWHSMSVGKGGTIWVNNKNGISSFVDRKFTAFYNPLLKTPQPPNVVFADRNGEVWFNYVGKNTLYKFKDGVFSESEIKIKQANLRTMFEDREGNLWLGTSGDGLVRVKKRRIKTYSTANGLLTNNVRAIVGDGKNGVWVASAEGLAHLENEKITNFEAELQKRFLSGLWLARSGILWTGHNSGLLQFKDGKFTDSFENNGEIYINAIIEDHLENIWVGDSNGLHKFQDGKLVTFSQSEGLINNKVATLAETRDGALWIGTISGVSRFFDGKFTNYTIEQGLSNNYVRDIFEEPDGAIWFGTYGGGLNRLKNGQITFITTKDGLFDDFISRILPDEKGNFWMLGNQGIFRANRQELNDFADKKISSINTINYGVADGMISSEGNGVNQPAGWRTPDGKMYFPTLNGVAVIEPSLSTGMPPSVVIETASIDRKPTPLNQNLQINPGQGNLQIEYTGLSFTRSEQVKFKYRLNGLENDWVNAGTRRTAYYPYLPSGEYKFEVMAENGEGIWSESPAVLKITVNPSFWQTWWFWILMAFVIAALTLFAFRWRIRQMERAQAVQEEFARRLINAHEAKQSANDENEVSLNQQIQKLTPTERHVLSLIAEDKTSKEIADQLFISYRTVERHRSNICKKLELQGSYPLVKFAVANKSKL